MTESDRGMLGEGNVRWDDLFRGLQEIDFNGNLVLENFSNSVPGMAEAVSLWRPSKYNADALAKAVSPSCVRWHANINKASITARPPQYYRTAVAVMSCQMRW